MSCSSSCLEHVNPFCLLLAEVQERSMANNLTFRNSQFILEIAKTLFVFKWQLFATVFFKIGFLLSFLLFCVCVDHFNLLSVLFADVLSRSSPSLLKRSLLSGLILRAVMRVCAYVSTFWVLGIAICQTSWLTWKLEEWLALTLATPLVLLRRYDHSFVSYYSCF